MTELAHSNPGTNPRPLGSGDPPARRTRALRWATDSVLELTGGVPQTINVTLQDGHPMFALAGTTTSYRAIGWQANGYALVLTFVFDAPIVEIGANTPSAWFSDVYTASGMSNQVGCVPPVPGEYHFNVQVTDGMNLDATIDPKIIVTPIIT